MIKIKEKENNNFQFPLSFLNYDFIQFQKYDNKKKRFIIRNYYYYFSHISFLKIISLHYI